MNTITGNKIGTRVNIFIDGSPISKDFGNEQQATIVFKQLLETKANPTKENIDKLYDYINKNIRVARMSGFEHDLTTGEIYMEGFNTPVPQLLVDHIEEYLDKGYPVDSFLNFWKLLMANPDVRIREDLFAFIAKHDFVITDKGYMVVYKTVNYLERVDDDLAELVTTSYLKIKDKWKKSPANFSVYKETIRILTGNYEEVKVEEEYDEAAEENLTHDEFYNEYGYDAEYREAIYEKRWVEKEEVEVNLKVSETQRVEEWIEDDEKEIEVLGTLEQMFIKIKNIEEKRKSVYTDKHTGTMRIVLGEPVVMDRSDCDGDPRNHCSYGLHVGSTKYVENFMGYKANENESPVLVCLVNPMNVVAVPEYDTSKMRVSEYYPIAKGSVVKDEQGRNKIEILDQPYFENDYISHEEKKLERILSENIEVRKTAKNTMMDHRSFDEYREILNSRIIDISQN